MSVFKGTAYVGQAKMGFGGFHKESTQPKSAWTNASGSGENVKSKGMLKQTFKPTCKTCGGKM